MIVNTSSKNCRSTLNTEERMKQISLIKSLILIPISMLLSVSLNHNKNKTILLERMQIFNQLNFKPKTKPTNILNVVNYYYIHKRTAKYIIMASSLPMKSETFKILLLKS